MHTAVNVGRSEKCCFELLDVIQVSTFSQACTKGRGKWVTPWSAVKTFLKADVCHGESWHGLFLWKSCTNSAK